MLALWVTVAFGELERWGVQGCRRRRGQYLWSSKAVQIAAVEVQGLSDPLMYSSKALHRL